MKKKYLIFDAGPIISITMAGLLPVLEKLKKEFNGDFILTPQVKKEVIDNPIKIKKYELEAIKIQELLERGVFTISSKIVSNDKIEFETNNILKESSQVLEAYGTKVRLIQQGEASCIAFSKLCKCENLIVIDERTTKLITESPENLRKIMENKLHSKIKINQNKIKFFKDFKYIRSCELMYIAYKKELLDIKHTKQNLEAVLYKLKYNGTAISSQEIKEIVAMS
jgi:hypothetical protein